MRHRIKKIKFKQGKDANTMMLRKLTVNFIRHGKITTTLHRVKVLKSQIERLVEKMKVESEANKNQLLSAVGDTRLLRRMFKDIGQPLKDKVGGYVRIVRLGSRQSDSAEIASLQWAYPVVFEAKKKPAEKIESDKPVKQVEKK